mmetsp:Transcript_47898/g.104437  ORF Transcript_47898/g.104437 Transcript_47898/m.104437 type:complete len:307 (+) Transcript_47898:79-999(+)
MPSSTNSANDREDPRDCNPMFKRLPAEVVARRGDRAGKKPQPVEKAPATTVELEQVLQKRPDGRAKWLAKALVQAADGRMDSQSLYSVVAHNRFIEELTDKAGKRMYRALHANLHVFSSRQRKFLEKECALARKYAATAFQGIQKDGDEDEKQEQAASAVEDMMARCRAFVRERQSERGERAENGGEDEDGDGEGGVEGAEAEEMKPPLLTAPVAPPPVIPPVVSKGASRSRSASPKKEKVTKSNKKKARESSSRRSRGRSDSHSRSERREKRKSRRSSGSSGHRSKRRRKDSDDSSDRKRKKKRH